jgi:Tol biopolymer transport system component
MALPRGARLGPYEIVEPIGTGGMGEVYRAIDRRLDRTVAVKVLPPAVAGDPERRTRFLREATAVSSLSHPHICVLHDIGNEGGTDFLVMEYLEGETLAQRLTRGPLTIDEVLKYGAQVADGLDKAHRLGLVHRDLKPGNVMLTKSGVKILDFGLAKAIPHSSFSASAVTAIAQDKPLTGEGTLVGTFQYMAPEQIEQGRADTRSDIFALGCVFYEMATGRRAFEGTSLASVVAAIVGSEPKPISRLAPLAPPALERLVMTCLAKDPDERFQSAADVKLQLHWIREGEQIARRVVRSGYLTHKIPWAVAAVSLVVALAFAMFGLTHRARDLPQLRAFLLPPADGLIGPFSFALSPDGTRIVFRAQPPPGRALWIQPLNASARQLPGTEGGLYPFWSPDSKNIGFFQEGKLKRIPAEGGAAMTLADAPIAAGGTWCVDGTIVFAPNIVGKGLYEIPSTGGTRTPLTIVDAAHPQRTHRWPWALPDGRHVIFFETAVSPGSLPGGRLLVADRKTRTENFLTDSDGGAEYANGHLLYTAQRTLVARPFDSDRDQPTFTGPAAPFIQRVTYAADRARSAFSVSSSDLLAYMAGEYVSSALSWYNHDGQSLGQIGTPGAFDNPRVSPKGAMIAVSSVAEEGLHPSIWIIDLARSASTRLTTERDEMVPIWAPDGRSVVYYSARSRSILRKDINGLGSPTPIVSHNVPDIPNDWSPNGQFLAYVEWAGGTPKLWIHRTAPAVGDYPLLGSESGEGEAAFSPDGRWLAYSSHESKQSEVYIIPFPHVTRKWKVSLNGGSQSLWARDGKHLYYLNPAQAVMAVAIDLRGDEPQIAAPRQLFGTRIVGDWGARQYDLSVDGSKFVINSRAEGSSTPITMYQNWLGAIRQ